MYVHNLDLEINVFLSAVCLYNYIKPLNPQDLILNFPL